MFLAQCHNSLPVSVSARKIFPREIGEILQRCSKNYRCTCAIAGGRKIEINGKETKSQQIFSARTSMLCTGGSEWCGRRIKWVIFCCKKGQSWPHPRLVGCVQKQGILIHGSQSLKVHVFLQLMRRTIMLSKRANVAKMISKEHDISRILNWFREGKEI